MHVCISLSGLADNYLYWGKLDEAYVNANLLLKIGKKIKNKE